MSQARKRFIPNSAFQVHGFWSWALVVALLGRIGAAKSRTILEAAHYDCCTWPDNRVGMTRKIATDLFGSIKDIFDTYVLQEHQLGYWREHKLGGAIVLYPNGSQMRWFGLDNPGKALSAEYGSIYVDQAEQLEIDEKKTVEGRVRLNRPPAPAIMPDGSVRMCPLRVRTVYAFNAMPETHWANLEFQFQDMQSPGGIQSREPETWEHRRLIRTTEPKKILSGKIVPAGTMVAEVLIAEPMANLENLSEDYQLRITEQRGPWYDRYVLALVGSFEGKTFPSFSRVTHVLNEPPEEWGWGEWGGYPPITWRRYRCVDWGYTNPLAMLWVARVPDDNPRYPGAWVVYQEIYMTQRTIVAHAAVAKGYDVEELAAMNRAIDRHNERVRTETAGQPIAPWEIERQLLERKERLSFRLQVCDPADPDARATLSSAGISMSPAVNDRQTGIQEVHKHLEPSKDALAGWTPKLLFMRDARRELDPELDPKNRKGDRPLPTCTWEEIGGIRWEKPPESDDKAPKEDIVKVNDHGFDAIRYLLRSYKDRGDMTVVRQRSASG